MERNPYAPPQSAVTAIAVPEAPIVRPRQVATAVGIQWLNVVLALFCWLIFLRPSETTFAALVGILAGNIVNVCLIVKVSRGRNWARLVFLVAALIDVAARIFQLFGPALVQTGELVHSAFEIPLMITAIYLLSTEPAKRWFRR